MTDKKIKVEFAPGAFADFDGTQEELEEFIAEIKSMFEGKTREEIEAIGRPMDEDDFEKLDEEDQKKLLGLLTGKDPRTLQ